MSLASHNSRHAPNDVDIDEKKQDFVLNCLNDGLAYDLEARDFKIGDGEQSPCVRE
jgi:hypothetical protein